MKIHELVRKQARKKRKPQKGRGGYRGHTCGSGDKGQKSRSGGSRGTRAGFEGGQKSFVRRAHKLRGAGSRILRRQFVDEQTITLAMLDKYMPDGSVISMETLRKAKLITPKHTGAKIVARGVTKKKFTLDKKIKASESIKNKFDAK